MFETSIGPVKSDGSTVFLRPETAQGIFLDFKTVLTFARRRPPFGIAQVGKSFRNEITPGNFIFRTLEFEQMEMEFFVPPEQADAWYAHWRQARMRLVRGPRHPARSPAPARPRPRGAQPLLRGTADVEYRFPIGWSELEGIANRGDFDLTAHAEARARSSRSSTRRPPLRAARHRARCRRRPRDARLPRRRLRRGGASRASTRTVLKLHPRLAPVKVAVLPLVRKDGQPELAREIQAKLRGDADRVRRGRVDRQALPAPGRDRHAVVRDGRPPVAGGPHGHGARPRLAGPGARRDRRARRRTSPPGWRRRGARRRTRADRRAGGQAAAQPSPSGAARSSRAALHARDGRRRAIIQPSAVG